MIDERDPIIDPRVGDGIKLKSGDLRIGRVEDGKVHLYELSKGIDSIRVPVWPMWWWRFRARRNWVIKGEEE